MLHEVSNFNIQVGGVSQLSQNARYGYELFIEQFAGVNAVMSGLSDGLTSGLISQKTWEQKNGAPWSRPGQGFS